MELTHHREPRPAITEEIAAVRANGATAGRSVAAQLQVTGLRRRWLDACCCCAKAMLVASRRLASAQYVAGCLFNPKFICPGASGIVSLMQPMSPWNDELTHTIIACIIHVHNVLGPGFHERIYCRALRIELQKQGFAVELETHIPIRYDGKLIGSHRLDMLIQNSVIVEAKNVETLTNVH
jgi:GxxExxY protein